MEHNTEDIYLCLKKIYNQLLNEFISLSKVLKYQEALEIFYLFDYLLKRNYIGDKDYKINDNAYILEKNDILGVNTFSGGVCRHKSSMLNDIYHKNNINSTVLLGSYHCNKFDRFDDVFKDSNIKKQVGEIEYNNKKYYVLEESGFYFTYECFHDDDFYEKNISKLNHAIVLAGNDRKILVDPELDNYYYFENDDRITAKTKYGKYFFIWEPKYDLPDFPMYDTSFQKIYEEIMKYESIPYKEVHKLALEIFEYLDNNKKILKEFINDNKDSIEQVKNACLCLRKNSESYLSHIKN